VTDRRIDMRGKDIEQCGINRLCRIPRLQPKVSNIRMVATVGIHMKPLVDEIPAFAAIVVTLIKPPKLNYCIDTGAVVGGAVGGVVTSFLDSLLPNILNGFLVWPERIVVPILGEEWTGPLTDLMLRHQGILKVRHDHAHPWLLPIS
jgi:hypothetical protein